MANEFVIKNGYFSQGNSNVTGSLQVSGSIRVVGSGSNILSVYGSQGNLLVATDTFSGSLLTVSDISGYPILDVTSDYYTSSINTIGFLNHTGSAGITGSLIVSNGITGSLFGTASYVTGSVFTSTNRALSASYALTSSVISVLNEPSPFIPQVRYITYVYNTGSNQSLITTGSLQYNHQLNTIFATASQALTASYLNTLKQNLIISGNIIPGGPYISNTSSYDLGSPTAAWNKIYVSNNSLHFVSGSVSSSIGFNNGVIYFNNATVNIPTGSTVPTASLSQTSSYVTGSIFTSANPALSASYAVTASFALNAGGTFNSTSSIIGNGLSSSFNINHGFNTRNLHITIYESSSNGETVYPDVRRINANTASIIFANPPSSNQYIVYISQ